MSVAARFSPLALLVAICVPLLTLGQAGCSQEVDDEEDAGSIARRDGGSFDAGSRDAGQPVDAGQVVDAGEAIDAGEAPDAGEAIDAGGAPDAGEEADAGEAIDAGEAPDAGHLSVCGDLMCEDDEYCSSCPSDCTCAVIHFQADWNETVTGELVAGGRFKVQYDLARRPECRGTEDGHPGWAMTLSYTFDMTVEAQEAPLAMTGQPFEPEIRIPADATRVFMWIRNTDTSGCLAWDSNDSANYSFAVTQP